MAPVNERPGVGKTWPVAGVSFLSSRRGVRIAYARHGDGPPLVCVPPWTTHLEAESQLSGYRELYDSLGEHHSVVLYDRWGTGLSDRERDDLSLAADVEVLADVVEHLKLRRFSLFGPSHGGPVAVSYALAAPRRVSHLVLYGNRASTLTSGDTWSALRELINANWRIAAQSIAAVACRGAAPSDVDTFSAVLQASATPAMTIALQDAAVAERAQLDLGALRVPTLVLHRRRDPLVSAQEATIVAGQIPDARLEILDDEPHVHCVGDVATLADRILAFTSGGRGAPTAQLSAREAEVLELIATGASNVEVAERLVLSVRTVERHLLNAYTKLGTRSRSDAIRWWLSGRADSSPTT